MNFIYVTAHVNVRPELGQRVTENAALLFFQTHLRQEVFVPSFVYGLLPTFRLLLTNLRKQRKYANPSQNISRLQQYFEDSNTVRCTNYLSWCFFFSCLFGITMYPLHSNNDMLTSTSSSAVIEEDDRKLPFDFAASTVKELMAEVLPQKLDLLSQHNRNIQQALNSSNHSKAKDEIRRASLLVKQIERELGNLERLKQSLEKSDHEVFDKMVNEPVRKASKMVQNFYELKTRQRTMAINHKEEDKAPEDSLCQLQVVEYPSDLQEAEAYAQSLEQVQQDCVLIHEAYTMLSQYVAESAPQVEKVEELTIIAESEVKQAERHLAYCAKKNLALYPLIGAAVGACVAGPVGLIIGAKVAVAAAVGGGVLGIQSALAIKKKKLEDLKAIDERVKATELS